LTLSSRSQYSRSRSRDVASETLATEAARTGLDADIDLGLAETGEVEKGPSSSIPHRAACLDVAASWRVGAKYGEYIDSRFPKLALAGFLPGGNGCEVGEVPREMGIPACSFGVGAEVRR
jgi:hypothetical protein